MANKCLKCGHIFDDCEIRILQQEAGEIWSGKIYEEVGDSALSGQFLFYTFFVAMVLCFVMAGAKKQLPGFWECVYGISIGVPNFYSSRFMLQALNTVPGVIAYPVYSVAGILLVTLAGVVLFRERLEKRQWIALGIILLSLILLNV